MKMSRKLQLYHLDIWVQKFIKHNKFYFNRIITGLPAFRLGDKKVISPFIQSILLSRYRLGYYYGGEGNK